MTPDSKQGLLSRLWALSVRFVKERKGFLSKEVSYLKQAVNCLLQKPLVFGAGAAMPFAVTTLVQYNVENYQLHMTSVNFQIYELKRQQDELFEIVMWIKSMKNFPVDPILFPKARTRQGATLENGDYESILDLSPGAGIGLLKSQKKQLDRLVRSVSLLDKSRNVELNVEGFASSLPFMNSPCKPKSESNKCNEAAANLRARQVRDYLKSKLPDPRFRVEARTWNDYNEMDQNRYYPYERSSSSESSPGLHVLNQAVHIAISSP